MWWTGDGVGMLIVTPVILTWAAHVRGGRRWTKRRVTEALLLFAGLALVADHLHSDESAVGLLRTSPYMVFPFLIWAALRLGPAGAATATLVLCAVTVRHLAGGTGPFAAPDVPPTHQILHAYAYLAFASLSSLLPAAVVRERECTQRELRDSEERHRSLFEPEFDTA